MGWSPWKKQKTIFVPFILSERIFFNICVLSQCIVYWIHFQDMPYFVIPKNITSCTFVPAFKIVGSLQCIFKLSAAENVWIKRNKKSFNEKKLKALRNDLNLICDENGLIRCDGKLKLEPLPYDAKRSYFTNSEHYLAIVIVEYFHGGLEHLTRNHTEALWGSTNALWIFRSRWFLRNVFKDCALYRRFEGQIWLQYPVAPPLTKLRL